MPSMVDPWCSINWIGAAPAILTLEKWRQEDQEFKFLLSYIVSLRMAWAT